MNSDRGGSLCWLSDREQKKFMENISFNSTFHELVEVFLNVLIALNNPGSNNIPSFSKGELTILNKLNHCINSIGQIGLQVDQDLRSHCLAAKAITYCTLSFRLNTLSVTGKVGWKVIAERPNDQSYLRNKSSFWSIELVHLVSELLASGCSHVFGFEWFLTCPDFIDQEGDIFV